MARKQRRPRTGNTILLVDDSPEVLESTRRLLEHEGHRVLTASSGAQALRVVAEERVHLLIVDYFMPVMTGEELVRQVRATGNHLTQIILATGYSGEKPARVMMQQLDIQGYHDKSEGAQKLLLWVDTALKTYRHLLAMEKHRKGLRFILDLTPELHRMQPVEDLLEALLWQLEGLLGAENSFLATFPAEQMHRTEQEPAEGFVALLEEGAAHGGLAIRVGTGRFCPGETVRSLPAGLAALVDEALEARSPRTEEDCSVVPLVLGILMFCAWIAVVVVTGVLVVVRPIIPTWMPLRSTIANGSMPHSRGVAPLASRTLALTKGKSDCSDRARSVSRPKSNS